VSLPITRGAQNKLAGLDFFAFLQFSNAVRGASRYTACIAGGLCQIRNAMKAGVGECSELVLCPRTGVSYGEMLQDA
jgi:hypothetical protein